MISEKESDNNKKIKNIQYKKFKIQDYLRSNRFLNNDIEVLFKLRSRTIDLKANFKTKHLENTKCSINQCTFDETQEHLFKNCEKILQHMKNEYKSVKYEDIFGKTKQQQKAVMN